jgi:hypothetical protein
MALLGIIILAVLNTVLDIIAIKSPSEQATSVAVSTLTINYESEARSAIESYFLVSGSLNTRLHPENFAQVATGPHLERLLDFDIPEGDDTVYTTTAFILDKVYVLEYDDTHMKTVGCGTIYQDVVTAQGEFVRTTPRVQLNSIYVFLREDGTWKMATGYSLWEYDNLDRDWIYVSEWEQEAIGDIESYMLTYLRCGMDD